MIDTNCPNPIDIYNRYITIKNEEKAAVRNKNNHEKYSASGAGLCIRKHWYDYNGYDKKVSQADDLRRMRLGTVMGEDFDKAIEWFSGINLEAQVPYDEGYGVKDLKFYCEKAISHKDLNINGHFDLLIVVTNQDNRKLGYLFDYKTAHSFKFKNLFGRKPDPNPSNNYEYQLGTYGFMIEEDGELCDEIKYMANIYINKDNSIMKMKEAHLGYMRAAKTYWTIVNNYQSHEDPPAFSAGSSGRAPYQTWECGKYCAYTEICDTPYKKKQEM